jgi:hypothetical protein
MNWQRYEAETVDPCEYEGEMLFLQQAKICEHGII